MSFVNANDCSLWQATFDLFKWANRQSSFNDHSVTVYSYNQSFKIEATALPPRGHIIKMWAFGNWPTFMTRLYTQLPPPPHLSPTFWPPCALLSAPHPQMMFAVVFPGEGDNWTSHPHCSLASYGLCPQLNPSASSPSMSSMFPSTGEGLLCTSRFWALNQHMDPRPAGGERWQSSARGSKVQGIQKGGEGDRQAEGVEPEASAAVAESHLPKGVRQALLC